MSHSASRIKCALNPKTLAGRTRVRSFSTQTQVWLDGRKVGTFDACTPMSQVVSAIERKARGRGRGFGC